MKKIFFIAILSIFSNNLLGEGGVHLTRDIATYIQNYAYEEEYEARLSSLICDCMDRFVTLENLIEKQELPETGSEGILIANYGLAYQTMDVYSFVKMPNTMANIKYVGKINSYGIEGVQNIQVDYQYISSTISHFLKNDRVTVSGISNVSDSGCYYIYAYRDKQSKSWLVPIDVLPNPGLLDETFFEPILDVIISANKSRAQTAH